MLEFSTKKEAVDIGIKEHDNEIKLQDSVLQKPVTVQQDLSDTKLNDLKILNAQDVINSFADKDQFGHLTTSIEITIEYWNPITTDMLRKRSQIVTLAPQICLESAGGYSTLILQFTSHRQTDMSRIWGILNAYGVESNKVDFSSLEVPVLTLTAVPLSLGGNYGMVATDPIFWCIQPSSPLTEENDQIRLLYQPEAIMFLNDNSFQPEPVIGGVRSEIALEQLSEISQRQRVADTESFRAEHEKEMSEYLSNQGYIRHSFKTTKEE